MMTCDECRQAIAVADLTDWGDMERVAAHCRTCPDCAGMVTQVRDSAQRVADVLAAIPPGYDSALVSRRAEATAALERQHHRRVRFGIRIGSASLLLVAGLAVAATRLMHPTYVSRNLMLHCLTPEQAGEIVGPIIGHDGRVIINKRPDALRLLRVTSTSSRIEMAERDLAKYDNPATLPAGASCAVAPDATR